jgi:hypothetical protein
MVSDFCICWYCPIAHERWANRDALGEGYCCRAFKPCGYPKQKNFRRRLPTTDVSEFHFGKNFGSRVSPPPPTLLKGLTGAGFARNLRKFLTAKDLEVKILITKNLRAFSVSLRIPLSPWLSSAFCLSRARLDVTWLGRYLWIWKILREATGTGGIMKSPPKQSLDGGPSVVEIS